MKILITGGNGFIGRNLIKTLNKEYEIFAPSSSELDLANNKLVEKYFQNKFFDVVIHCAIKGGRRNVEDSALTLQQNLQMFFNLMKCKGRFDRFINFSSGADYDKSKNVNHINHNVFDSYPLSPYGMSKNIISRMLKNVKGSYNFRVYGVFGIDEDENRFMVSNIKRYKNKKPIEIHKNRYWDFFYIKDLINIVKYYIDNPNLGLDDEMDLVYSELFTLVNIGELINKLDSHQVEIELDDKYGRDLDYLGNKTIGVNLDIELIGLQKGLEEIYNAL